MHPTRNRLPGRRSERGSALVALFVIVIICGALAVATLLPNLSRHREAKSAVERERAFQLAEAGIDFGIAEMRKSSGVLPATATTSGTPGNGTSGSYALEYVAGNANGQDDDGDGVADDSDEADFVQLVSTGRFNAEERTIRVLMRRSVDVPTIIASIQFNVENPIVDLNGNAFNVSGFDHDMDGNEDAALPANHALAAPTDPANIEAQLNGNDASHLEGAGGTPSITYVDAIDLDRLVEQAKAAKTHTLTPGTYANLTIGSPDPSGVAFAVCEGDLHLSGQAEGYGILVVDGDLTCSGDLLWTGIVIVRGRCSMTGGASEKRLIGAMIVGEEVVGAVDGTQTVKLAGTVDLRYSTAAIELAHQRLAMMTVLSWQEVANP